MSDERRMADLSADSVSASANMSNVGVPGAGGAVDDAPASGRAGMRRSARGNWHATPRIGIMGGTFDPIHNGHLVAASEVAWVYDHDEVIFVPTGRTVFKLD